MKKTLKFGLLLFFILFAGSVYSAENGETKNTVEKQELITLYIGEVKIIPVNTPTRVVVNNPEVADIISVSKDDILLTAKGQGTTNIIWWDTKGQHTSQIQVFLEQMILIKQRIDAILKDLNLVNVYTQAADSEGKVLLLGVVKNVEDVDRIDTALSLLKSKTVNLIQVQEERASIEIDAMILELKKDGSKKLGIAWPNGASLTEPSNRSWGTLAGIPDALFRISDWTRARFTATVDFLVQEGSARILSRPRLVCQSGKEAELLVGGEKPVMTTSVAATTGSTGTTVEYKEYGIRLKIKPKLATDGRIQLNLNVEVSDLVGEVTLGDVNAPTARAYPLTKRYTSSQVYLNDGQTIAISGLINQKTEEELKKFPWLGDIPILGVFFRHKSTTSGGGRGEFGDSELVITLTPTLIKDLPKQDAAKTAALKPEQEPVKTAAAKSETPIPAKETKPVSEVKKETKPVTEAKIMVPAVNKVEAVPLPDPAAALNGYVNAVTKRVQDNVVYPWAAKQGEMQGTVKLELSIDSTGKLLEVKVKESSGFSIFDENAASMVKRLAPYPSFPAELAQKDLRFEIPIVYKLK